MIKNLMCMGLLFLVLGAGCGKKGISGYEMKERGNALFSQAITAEKGGDVDGAIKLYKQVMIDEPRAYSAHFMLATLLQDHSEDYIGAIYHYNRYIELQPKSEKVELAQQRIKISEHLLAPKILKSVGDTSPALSQAHMLKEAARLNGIIARLEGEKATLNTQIDKNNAMVKRLAAENESLRKIVNKMRVTSTVDAPERSLSERTKDAREPDDGGSTGFSKSELDALRREATDLKSSRPSDTVDRSVVDVPSVKSVLDKVQNRLTGEENKRRKDESDREARETAKGSDLSEFSLFKTPDNSKTDESANEKRTYVVQPGDTLMRISTRFYGDPVQWKKIRNANRSQIDPDGRVRAGQIILIP